MFDFGDESRSGVAGQRLRKRTDGRTRCRPALDFRIADFAPLSGNFFDFMAQYGVEHTLTHTDSFGLHTTFLLNYSLIPTHFSSSVWARLWRMRVVSPPIADCCA